MHSIVLFSTLFCVSLGFLGHNPLNGGVFHRRSGTYIPRNIGFLASNNNKDDKPIDKISTPASAPVSPPPATPEVTSGTKSVLEKRKSRQLSTTPSKSSPVSSPPSPLPPPPARIQKSDAALDLPDIKSSVKKRKKKKQQKDKSASPQAPQKKIDRSDMESFSTLLELDPSADMDESYFADREYGTVSALLGEGARKFLGVPLPALQIGHFFGLLTIILMSTVVYPGFPLTDLPVAIRVAIRNGLCVVAVINLLMALGTGVVVEKKGQKWPLWFAKTLVVGGLAFDQLMQLPDKDKSRK